MGDFHGYIDPDFPNPNGPGDVPIIAYGYMPSITFTVVGIAISTCLLVTHLVRTVHSKAWFTIPLVVACWMELVGYIFRAMSNMVDPYRLSFFVGQYVMITTAPILITASLYFCFTEVLAILERKGVPAPLGKCFTPTVLLWTFIAADISSAVIQVTGAGVIGEAMTDHKSPTIAIWIVLAGISVQTIFFIIYLWLFAIALKTVLGLGMHEQRSFRLHTKIIGIASCSMLVRLVFRIAEAAQGVFGYLSIHEVYLVALEFAPVMLALGLLAVWHPGDALKSQKPEAAQKSEEV